MITLRPVGKGDHRDLVFGCDVLGEKLDRLDHEFEAPLVVHRTRTVDHHAQIQGQARFRRPRRRRLRSLPAARRGRNFRRSKARTRCSPVLEAKRFGHLRCSPAQIVGVSAMLWQLNRCPKSRISPVRVPSEPVYAPPNRLAAKSPPDLSRRRWHRRFACGHAAPIDDPPNRPRL